MTKETLWWWDGQQEYIQKEILIISDQTKQIILENLNKEGNNDFSIEPGVRIQLTEEWKNRIMIISEKNWYPISENNIIQINDNIWQLDLPNGIYHCDLWGIQFGINHHKNWEYLQCIDPFDLNYNYIRRVEWYHWELWKNRDYRD